MNSSALQKEVDPRSQLERILLEQGGVRSLRFVQQGEQWSSKMELHM